MALDRNSRVYIAGHHGLVGSAIWRALSAAGFTDLVGLRSSEVDLRSHTATAEMIADFKPNVVIDAAARVGGILANISYPADFISDNLRIQTSLMDAALIAGVERFLFLGSSCIYPKFAPQPIQEVSLLTGPLEPTNDAYAIAKIAGVMQVQAVRRQHGLPWISAMPTNLYGPNDNFSPEDSHVLPGLIRRFHDANVKGTPEVVVWGTGTPRREFLHVDDLARACLVLLDRYDDPTPINIGTGEDIAIRDLVELVRTTVGYEGDVVWDASRPDGTPRKLLDVSRIRSLGWEPRIDLADGLQSTYAWYRSTSA